MYYFIIIIIIDMIFHKKAVFYDLLKKVFAVIRRFTHQILNQNQRN